MKVKVCDWCGKDIPKEQAWVRMPVCYDGKPFTYHVGCYCLIFTHEVLRHIINDDEERSVGAALGKVLRALDPAYDEDDC